MTFFVDNNLSKYIVRGMKGFGEDVVHLTEHFPASAADIDWLPFVGENGYILLTRDRNIRYNTAERQAFKKYKVGAFFLGGKGLSRCAQIRQIVRCWHRLKEYDKKTRRPYMFTVSASGKGIDKMSFR